MMMTENTKSIKTYMNFTKDIDPAHIMTMSDLELSIALATTLVVFNEDRELVSGLAEKWEYILPNKIKFTLKNNLKWSNSSPISAADYKQSLERSAKLYPNDLKALFDSITHIEAEDSTTLIFTTKMDVNKSGILLKLTEPMYGLVHIKNSAVDTTITSGPYFLSKYSDSEIHLKANTNWYNYSSLMPNEVYIKRPIQGKDLVAEFNDHEWANLISGTSLMSQQTSQVLKTQGHKTWNRSLDKVFSLFASKKFIEHGGLDFLKMLSKKLDLNKINEGLVGYIQAEQFFPRGYELWSSQKINVRDFKNTQVDQIRIIIPDNPYALSFKDRLKHSIEELSHTKVICELIPLPQMNERLKKGDYDLLAAGFAVADPNFEGAMSFFVERDPAPIQSSQAPFNFSSQTKAARSLPSSQERAQRMREIMTTAQENGFFLPLFHFSSLVVAKSNIDLSAIPNSDETVLFSKIRIQ